MSESSPSTRFAVRLLGEFVRLGLRDLVLCPGSRSQALALAAAEYERAGLMHLHVRLDERVAGFLALGLAAESGVPAAVVVTSGTAVANLHPAVLEAHHSGVPMLLLTADRPTELRGIRSNQTTHQPGIFGRAARFTTDVPAPGPAVGFRTQAGDEALDPAALASESWAHAVGTTKGVAGPGPVHLNLAFREPLSSVSDAEDELELERVRAHLDAPASSGDAVTQGDRRRRSTLLVERGPRTVVIAGNAAGPAAEDVAHAGGWPLIAEVTSGSRFGRNLVAGYRPLLDDPELGGRIERAIVFGHPTLSRQVPALLKRADVETIVVAPHGAEAYDPGRNARVVGQVSVTSGPVDRAWLGAWVVASRAVLAAQDDDVAPDLEAGHSHDPAQRLAFAQAEFAAIRRPLDRRLLVEAVWRATWPHDRLVFGASRLIREADQVLAGKKVRVHANRGLAGIDGTTATATGIALASQADGSPGVTRVLVGDLTFLHDIGALLPGYDERMPRLQVIVGNDGGGTIFDGLEVAASAAPEAMQRVLYTPQRVDIQKLAEGFGWGYVRAKTRAELDQALTAPVERPVVIEVPLDR
jgi:2-succinyl-5-enolpyruvyl-6-hydroxy-3-cyclohexene-1-carboxylate synthase